MTVYTTDKYHALVEDITKAKFTLEQERAKGASSGRLEHLEQIIAGLQTQLRTMPYTKGNFWDASDDDKNIPYRDVPVPHWSRVVNINEHTAETLLELKRLQCAEASVKNQSSTIATAGYRRLYRAKIDDADATIFETDVAVQTGLNIDNNTNKFFGTNGSISTEDIKLAKDSLAILEPGAVMTRAQENAFNEHYYKFQRDHPITFPGPIGGYQKGKLYYQPDGKIPSYWNHGAPRYVLVNGDINQSYENFHMRAHGDWNPYVRNYQQHGDHESGVTDYVSRVANYTAIPAQGALTYEVAENIIRTFLKKAYIVIEIPMGINKTKLGNAKFGTMPGIPLILGNDWQASKIKKAVQESNFKKQENVEVTTIERTTKLQYITLEQLEKRVGGIWEISDVTNFNNRTITPDDYDAMSPVDKQIKQIDAVKIKPQFAERMGIPNYGKDMVFVLPHAIVKVSKIFAPYIETVDNVVVKKMYNEVAADIKKITGKGLNPPIVEKNLSAKFEDILTTNINRNILYFHEIITDKFRFAVMNEFTGGDDSINNGIDKIKKAQTALADYHARKINDPTLLWTLNYDLRSALEESAAFFWTSHIPYEDLKNKNNYVDPYTRKNSQDADWRRLKLNQLYTEFDHFVEYWGKVENFLKFNSNGEAQFDVHTWENGIIRTDEISDFGVNKRVNFVIDFYGNFARQNHEGAPFMRGAEPGRGPNRIAVNQDHMWIQNTGGVSDAMIYSGFPGIAETGYNSLREFNERAMVGGGTNEVHINLNPNNVWHSHLFSQDFLDKHGIMWVEDTGSYAYVYDHAHDIFSSIGENPYPEVTIREYLEGSLAGQFKNSRKTANPTSEKILSILEGMMDGKKIELAGMIVPLEDVDARNAYFKKYLTWWWQSLGYDAVNIAFTDNGNPFKYVPGKVQGGESARGFYGVVFKKAFPTMLFPEWDLVQHFKPDPRKLANKEIPFYETLGRSKQKWQLYEVLNADVEAVADAKSALEIAIGTGDKTKIQFARVMLDDAMEHLDFNTPSETRKYYIISIEGAVPKNMVPTYDYLTNKTGLPYIWFSHETATDEIFIEYINQGKDAGSGYGFKSQLEKYMAELQQLEQLGDNVNNPRKTQLVAGIAEMEKKIEHFIKVQGDYKKTANMGREMFDALFSSDVVYANMRYLKINIQTTAGTVILNNYFSDLVSNGAMKRIDWMNSTQIRFDDMELISEAAALGESEFKSDASKIFDKTTGEELEIYGTTEFREGITEARKVTIDGVEFISNVNNNISMFHGGKNLRIVKPSQYQKTDHKGNLIDGVKGDPTYYAIYKLDRSEVLAIRNGEKFASKNPYMQTPLNPKTEQLWKLVIEYVKEGGNEIKPPSIIKRDGTHILINGSNQEFTLGQLEAIAPTYVDSIKNRIINKANKIQTKDSPIKPQKVDYAVTNQGRGVVSYTGEATEGKNYVIAKHGLNKPSDYHLFADSPTNTFITFRVSGDGTHVYFDVAKGSGAGAAAELEIYWKAFFDSGVTHNMKFLHLEQLSHQGVRFFERAVNALIKTGAWKDHPALSNPDFRVDDLQLKLHAESKGVFRSTNSVVLMDGSHALSEFGETPDGFFEMITNQVSFTELVRRYGEYNTIFNDFVRSPKPTSTNWTPIKLQYKPVTRREVIKRQSQVLTDGGINYVDTFELYLKNVNQHGHDVIQVVDMAPVKNHIPIISGGSGVPDYTKQSRIIIVVDTLGNQVGWNTPDGTIEYQMSIDDMVINSIDPTVENIVDSIDIRSTLHQVFIDEVQARLKNGQEIPAQLNAEFEEFVNAHFNEVQQIKQMKAGVRRRIRIARLLRGIANIGMLYGLWGSTFWAKAIGPALIFGTAMFFNDGMKIREEYINKGKRHPAGDPWRYWTREMEALHQKFDWTFFYLYLPTGTGAALGRSPIELWEWSVDNLGAGMNSIYEKSPEFGEGMDSSELYYHLVKPEDLTANIINDLTAADKIKIKKINSLLFKFKGFQKQLMRHYSDSTADIRVPAENLRLLNAHKIASLGRNSTWGDAYKKLIKNTIDEVRILKEELPSKYVDASNKEAAVLVHNTNNSNVGSVFWNINADKPKYLYILDPHSGEITGVYDSTLGIVDGLGKTVFEYVWTPIEQILTGIGDVFNSNNPGYNADGIYRGTLPKNLNVTSGNNWIFKLDGSGHWYKMDAAWSSIYNISPADKQRVMREAIENMFNANGIEIKLLEDVYPNEKDAGKVKRKRRRGPKNEFREIDPVFPGPYGINWPENLE